MSRVVINAPRYRGLPYFSNHAVGTESGEIRKTLMEYFDDLSNVMSIQPRLDAVRELLTTFQECSREDWDSEGALPISTRTLQEAVKFLTALPLTIQTPEVIPEPMGAIGFEWRGGKNALFVASVHGTQKITYAGLFGPGVTVHGSEDFNDSIPGAIVNNLQRLRDTR